LEDGDFASETAVRLCELETNVATTDDDEMFGEAVQLEEFDIGEGLGFAQAGDGRDGGVRAQVEEDALADDRARASVVEANLKGFGAGEAGFTHHELSVGFAIVLQVSRDQRFDHLAFAPPDGLHVDRDRTGDGAKLTGMTCEVGDLRAPNFIFRRKAIDVWAGAADPSALDDYGWLAQLRQVPGEIFSTFSATDDYVLTTFGSHRSLSIRSAGCSFIADKIPLDGGPEIGLYQRECSPELCSVRSLAFYPADVSAPCRRLTLTGQSAH